MISKERAVIIITATNSYFEKNLGTPDRKIKSKVKDHEIKM